jgi:DNA-binding response OmpR family regulator
LTARETSLLAYLIANAGNPIHRADLARNGAWNPDDRATDVHISHIRRKLQAAGMSDLCVKPVRGFGYQLSLPQQVPEPSETCPPG